MSQLAEKKSRTGQSRLGRWFWGAIILMAVISLVLTGMAALRQNEHQKTATPTSVLQPYAEESAAHLEEQLSKANEVALKAVDHKIGALLDTVYEPAYAAIPNYSDFHYSIYGEYAELTEAALGNVRGKLEAMLFAGLDTRIQELNAELGRTLASTFQAELERDFSKTGRDGNDVLAQLRNAAVEDAVKRIKITVPIGTAATFGAAATAKVASKGMAKKIVSKLAAKAAVKTGGKLAAAGTGAGAGVVVCSWAGPGAGLCAAVGGIGAWIVADYGIVKLDEFWTRDDFEADLEEMLDELKADHEQALKQLTRQLALKLQKDSEKVVQQYDFSLRELYGEKAQSCRVAEDLVARYQLMQSNAGERQPSAVQVLLDAETQHSNNRSLRPLVQEIHVNLNNVAIATVSRIEISGNLPNEFRANRDVSGRFKFNESTIDFSKTDTSKFDGFSIRLSPEITLDLNEPLDYSIAIEQHLRLKKHRFFAGAGSLDPPAAVDKWEGLRYQAETFVPIVRDTDATRIEMVTRKPKDGPKIKLSIELRAQPLAKLEHVLPGC